MEEGTRINDGVGGEGKLRWAARVQAPLSMVLVQIFTTGMMVLSKIVISRGMFIFSLLVYRNAIGALFVAPFAFFFERGMRRNLGWRPLLWICLNAWFGVVMATGLYYYGLRDTTASDSTVFLNVIPVVTFILSAALGMESLRLCSLAGKAKMTGALICVAGAMVISLYKGKPLHLWPSSLLRAASPDLAGEADAHNMARGTLLLTASSFGFAFWFIVQAKMWKVFPSKYWATMLTCAVGCLYSLLIGAVVDRRKSSWVLGWDLQLLTIVYSGVLNTGATFCLVSWTISHKGPTYPSMFNALSLVFTTVVECIFMGQNLTVGSVIGMTMIIAGLYAFLWAKTKESPELKQKTNKTDLLPTSAAVAASDSFPLNRCSDSRNPKLLRSRSA